MADGMEKLATVAATTGAAVGGSTLATAVAVAGGIGIVSWGLWELYKYLSGDSEVENSEVKELKEKLTALSKENEELRKERDELKHRLEIETGSHQVTLIRLDELNKRYGSLINDYEKLVAETQNKISSGEIPSGKEYYEYMQKLTALNDTLDALKLEAKGA